MSKLYYSYWIDFLNMQIYKAFNYMYMNCIECNALHIPVGQGSFIISTYYTMATTLILRIAENDWD